MYRYGMMFEWDVGKEMINVHKHGVNFVEAMESFYDPDGFQMKDCSHSLAEIRFYWIGKSKIGRILTTYFTKRHDKIRIIGSAQWRKFRRLYYERTKNR